MCSTVTTKGSLGSHTWTRPGDCGQQADGGMRRVWAMQGKDDQAADAPPPGPNAREGEHVFGVAHIFASFNDTFVVRTVYPSGQ